MNSTLLFQLLAPTAAPASAPFQSTRQGKEEESAAAGSSSGSSISQRGQKREEGREGLMLMLKPGPADSKRARSATQPCRCSRKAPGPWRLSRGCAKKRYVRGYKTREASWLATHAATRAPSRAHLLTHSLSHTLPPQYSWCGKRRICSCHSVDGAASKLKKNSDVVAAVEASRSRVNEATSRAASSPLWPAEARRCPWCWKTRPIN